MSDRAGRRGWIHPVARVVLVGALGAAVLVGAGRVGAVSPAPEGREPVPPGAATSVSGYCPGDPFAGGQEDAPQADQEGSVVGRAAPGSVLKGVVRPSTEPGTISVAPVSGEPAASPTGAPESGPTSRSRDELDERPIAVRGTRERAPGLVAGQSFTADGKEVAGLAAMPCTSPTADAWLVAGGGQEGRQERLVLTNPGGNSVTAELDLLGRDAGSREVVVPPGERKVVLLDAISGTRSAQAVHVRTRGGLVVPAIAEHHRDGLVPAGVETVGPTAAPATRLVIPGNADAAGRGVAIGAPGDQDAVVRIRAVGSEPSSGAEVATVPAGEVADVDLPEVDGMHTWVIESDEPVVAAGHVTTQGSGDRADMAWTVATPAFARLGGAALPADPPSAVRRLVEVTAVEGPVEADVLVLADDEVRTEHVSVDEGRSESLEIGRADAVWVRPDGGKVRAAVLLLGPEGTSEPAATSVPVLPSRVSEREVQVVPAP